MIFLMIGYVLIAWIIYTICLYKNRNVSWRKKQDNMDFNTTLSVFWGPALFLFVFFFIPIVTGMFLIHIMNEISEKIVGIFDK